MALRIRKGISLLACITGLSSPASAQTQLCKFVFGDPETRIYLADINGQSGYRVNELITDSQLLTGAPSIQCSFQPGKIDWHKNPLPEVAKTCKDKNGKVLHVRGYDRGYYTEYRMTFADMADNRITMDAKWLLADTQQYAKPGGIPISHTLQNKYSVLTYGGGPIWKQTGDENCDHPILAGTGKMITVYRDNSPSEISIISPTGKSDKRNVVIAIVREYKVINILDYRNGIRPSF